MARIRTIKPEFWKHEALSELPEATHMLAAALLNYADDEGYFNAHPKLVQAECSPLREPSVPIPDSLRSLQATGYIELGTGEDGKRYGRIVSFTEHQRVSHPAKSKIAEKSIVWECSRDTTEDFEKAPERVRPEQGIEQGIELNGTGKGVARSADADEPALALQAYNEVAEEVGWQTASKLTPPRRSALKARLRDCGGVEGWRAAMARARESPFLRGERGRDKAHENWSPGIDFFLQQKSFTKLLEGAYDDRNCNQSPTGFDALVAGARAAAAGRENPWPDG